MYEDNDGIVGSMLLALVVAIIIYTFTRLF